MGHHLTENDKELITELIYFYNFNRKRLIIDIICFLLISFLLFYLIVLLQKN